MTLILRSARSDDVDILFNWVNAADVLAQKLETSEPIQRSDHERWFATRLQNPDCRIFIIEQDGDLCGQIRFERKNETFEVDIFIIPDQRQKHLAREALKTGMRQVVDQMPEAVIEARVLHGNEASKRLFVSAGFCKTGETETYLEYVWSEQTNLGDT